MADPKQGPEREPEEGSDQPELYNPSTVQVNRARQQGIGVGQKDMDRQHDPTRLRSADQFSRGPDRPYAGAKAPKAGSQGGGMKQGRNRQKGR